MVATSAQQFPWQIELLAGLALLLVVTALVLRPVANRIAARRQHHGLQ